MSSSNTQGSRRGRRRTKTSAFGAPGRIGHDSTSFYDSRLYSDRRPDKTIPYLENPLSPDVVNQVFCKSSESMDELPDCSVHLMVTSPPYNVGKEYDENLSLKEYLSLLKTVMAEVHRVLVPGGRGLRKRRQPGQEALHPPAHICDPGHAGPRIPDAWRGHLGQVLQRQPIHGMGQLDIGRESRPP